MSAVIRLGYVHLRVTDLEEARNHYSNTLGMEVVHEEPGKLWLKCWDEWDHHSLVLEEGGVGLVKLGYKVESPEAMADYESRAQKFGVTTGRFSKGENLTVGDGVRLTLPSEHAIELYTEMEYAGTETGAINPEAWPRNLRGVGREEPLENLYGPEDVDSALAAFQAVEPNLWLEETPAASPAPDAPAVESPEIPAPADGRTQRIDVSHFQAPAEPAPPARPPEPPAASLAEPPVTTPSGRELSEADIEAVAEKVARRVIEKLSERIVREIAWDVVPETAELAVRERIRELESGVE